MKIKLSTHRSTADWDVLEWSDWTPFADWGLTTTQFVSPPTSLYIDPRSPGADKYALCNLTQTLDVKAGILASYFRKAAPGVGRQRFYIGVTGPGSKGIAINLPGITTKWFYYRALWYQGYNTSCEAKTIWFLEAWTDGGWQSTLGVRYGDPLTGPVNRVGIGGLPQSLGRRLYFDNTEIWRFT